MLALVGWATFISALNLFCFHSLTVETKDRSQFGAHTVNSLPALIINENQDSLYKESIWSL